MDKLVATVVIVALALFLYLGVFQGGMGTAVNDHGAQIDSQMDNSKTEMNKNTGTVPSRTGS